MAKTASTMLPLGTHAPNFSLVDVLSGYELCLAQCRPAQATVIMFICNHCPYVKHVSQELARLADDYQARNVAFIAINSNDIATYPEDAPDKMAKMAQTEGYSFPYLFDETQEVAKAYQAACTPDFYLFDEKLRLVYRGQLDDSRPGNAIEVTGDSLRSALNCVLNNKPVSLEQKPSLGCSIKWKK